MSDDAPRTSPASSDAPRLRAAARPATVGMVSLGCPKALVDSERILSRLRADGYAISPEYAGADAVIVNTCGFLDSAKAESLEAIGEAVAENGRVIVTGCLGKDADAIRAAHPKVLAVTKPQAYEEVVGAVRAAAPMPRDAFLDLVPPQPVDVRLTPGHYAYVKISEGCNHRCRFCVIPSMRGKLASRPAGAVLREAEKLVAGGVRELLVISQDTSAYGLDLKHAASDWRGAPVRAHIQDLAEGLARLNAETGVWVRLHYVYPYPHVDALIPLMAESRAEGRISPYLDIPFQHASPDVLRAMRRPADQEKTLDRITAWRRDVPDLALRSTFIVGFPGETERDFELLLEWLRDAQLDRVGCFQYENVEGAAANDLPNHVPQEVKQDRWERFMAAAQEISVAKLAAKVGRTVEVLVDEVDEDGATGRTLADAPEIDGEIDIVEGFEGLSPGDVLPVEVLGAEVYDLWGRAVD